MESKRLGLLHELVPNVELIGVLLNANNPFFNSQLKDLNEASRSLGVKVHVELASAKDEIAKALKHSSNTVLARCLSEPILISIAGVPSLSTP